RCPGAPPPEEFSHPARHELRSINMGIARHPRPKELEEASLEQIATRYVGRFRDKVPDWAAFEDAKIEGYKRAQHRFIGAGGSGKHDDPSVLPARNFTCRSCMSNRAGGMRLTPTRWRRYSSFSRGFSTCSSRTKLANA